MMTSVRNPLNSSDYKSTFREWSKIIHPDKCKLPDAVAAFDRLTTFRNEIENGIVFSDEISTITMKGNVLTFVGDRSKLQQSYDNYQIISKISGVPDSFKFYLPESMTLHPDRLEVVLRSNVNGTAHHSVRLTDIVLEEKHVKWILNRCLEFTSLLNCVGDMVHCGVGPNSTLICPETHGVQIISFYHTVQSGYKLRSLNGQMKRWYPAFVFDTKRADSSIDLELCKRFACSLLGDASGVGTKLKGSIDPDFSTFLLTSHVDIRDGYIKYVDFLNKSPRLFHKLDL